MKLTNHICHRFFTDPSMLKEIIEWQSKKTALANPDLSKEDILESAKLLYLILEPRDNKTFLVASTVMANLSLFDSKKSMTIEGWKVFEGLPSFKKTYIVPMAPGDTNSTFIRVVKTSTGIHFMHLEYSPRQAPIAFKPTGDKDLDIVLERQYKQESKYTGQMFWTLFWVDFSNDIASSNFEATDEQVQKIAPFLYSLLAFTELSDITEKVIPSGERYGTAKTFKTQNTLPFPVTLITSNWNIKTVSSGGFTVRGHAAWRLVGKGRSSKRLVYIEPYEKEGYTVRLVKL